MHALNGGVTTAGVAVKGSSKEKTNHQLSKTQSGQEKLKRSRRRRRPRSFSESAGERREDAEDSGGGGGVLYLASTGLAAHPMMICDNPLTRVANVPTDPGEGRGANIRDGAPRRSPPMAIVSPPPSRGAYASIAD